VLGKFYFSFTVYTLFSSDVIGIKYLLVLSENTYLVEYFFWSLFFSYSEMTRDLIQESMGTNLQ